MKELILLLVIYCSCCSCSTTTNEVNKNDKLQDDGVQLELLADSSLRSGVINDTGILGFRFGMTLDEYISHHDYLIKRGDISKYGLPFTLSSPKVEGNGDLIVGFNDGKLWSFGVKFSDPKLTNYSLLVFDDLKKRFKSKYGDYQKFTQDKIGDELIFKIYWFRGNQKIILSSGPLGARVEYIDIDRERKWKQSQRDQEKEDSVRIINQI